MSSPARLQQTPAALSAWEAGTADVWMGIIDPGTSSAAGQEQVRKCYSWLCRFVWFHIHIWFDTAYLSLWGHNNFHSVTKLELFLATKHNLHHYTPMTKWYKEQTQCQKVHVNEMSSRCQKCSVLVITHFKNTHTRTHKHARTLSQKWQHGGPRCLLNCYFWLCEASLVSKTRFRKFKNSKSECSEAANRNNKQGVCSHSHMNFIKCFSKSFSPTNLAKLATDSSDAVLSCWSDSIQIFFTLIFYCWQIFIKSPVCKHGCVICSFLLLKI